jgi:hypothetical protein
MQKPVPLDPEIQLGPENRSALYYYSDEHVNGVINVISTVASSLTPMVSIIVLYVVQSTRIRLGLVCVFTLIFSLVLAVATKARRIEIFAATAAWVAPLSWIITHVLNAKTVSRACRLSLLEVSAFRLGVDFCSIAGPRHLSQLILGDTDSVCISF